MNQMITVQQHTVSDIERMASAFAVANLFGVTSTEQALALCLIAQAEGRHPASAAQDYHIINGKPSKKADAMLRDFLNAGGKVEWHQLDDTVGDATFAHSAGGSVRIHWDMQRAQRAQLRTPMWSKYPRQMLRARVVSEGVRTVYPMATSGMYVPEEVQEFAPAREPAPLMIEAPERVEAPPVTAETIDRETGEITTHGKTAATRQIDGEMRNEIDDCLDAAQLRRLWRSKAFKAEMDRHPADWKDAVTDYANERFADMEAATRQMKSWDFSRLETKPEDSLGTAQFKVSVAMEEVAAALGDAPSPEAVKTVWDEMAEGRFEGEALSRLQDVYAAALRQFGIGE